MGYKPDFEVKAYYREGGALAMHTWHTTPHSKDMEVSAFRSRPEIGRIEVLDRRSDGDGFKSVRTP